MLAQLFALLPVLALTSASPVVKRESSRLIESGRNNGQCLSIVGGRAAVAAGQVTDGTPVVTLDCGVASYWDISRGSGSVIVSGTNYAFDIGLSPTNNGPVKVWTSYPTAPQQTWFLTGDNRIAQTGGNQCLDQGDNGPQTYQCTTGNTNQVWNVRFNDPTPSASASSAAPSPSASTTPPPASGDILPLTPKGDFVPDVAGAGSRIRPLGRSDLCTSVDGEVAQGAVVTLKYCSKDGPGAAAQSWDLPSVTGNGQVRLHNTTLCIDAGGIPSNGNGAKIWGCADVPQQKFTYSSGNIKTSFNNQCLDIQKESDGLVTVKPFSNVARIITWQCSTNGDPYQAFTTAA